VLVKIDPANLILYSVPYVIFWAVVFAAMAKLAGRVSKKPDS
jgi:hypothetical protein